jgi:protein-S-isoprenylcysteine O-methyltransferase Ste14
VLMIGAKILYLAGLVFSETLRLPHRLRRIRSSRRWSGANPLDRLSEVLVLVAVLIGIWALPIVYVFTDWLRSFNHSLPGWAVWLGAGVFLTSLVVRWRTQRALGELWSFTVELAEKHALVTDGPYSRIRHPLYASLLLWAAAQPLLLQNVVAGWSGAVAVALIWLVRVPREEKLMLERFGAEYEQYMARTGRLIPRCRVRRQAG